jgi:peptide/nickel transport system permease protein
MLRYLARRFLWAVMLFVAVTLVTYVIFYVIPANPAALAAGHTATPERVREVEEFLGLNDPLYVQYGRFLERLLPVEVSEWPPSFHSPSLGFSFANREDVTDKIIRAAPVTASLVFGAMLMILAVAIPIGILSALRPRSLLDRAAMVYVLIGISLPSFWIGLILSYVVGFRLGWFPISGYCDAVNPPEAASCGGPADWAYHMFLPWLTIAIVSSGTYVRFVRADVMETMNQDYVRTARAKGAPENRVMRQHILRNAMLPVVTMVGMDIALLLGGAIFTETVFNLPGLGKLALDGITNFDLPVIQGVTVFAAVAVIVFNLMVDIMYAWVDPRIRLT